MGWILDILEAGLSLFGWFKKSEGEKLGQSKQELADAKNALDQAAEKAKIDQKVGDYSGAQLDSDLDKRVCRNPSDD